MTSMTSTKDCLGKPPSKPVQTHCKRELMHAVWELLLDDDFMKAYKEVSSSHVVMV